MSNSLLEMAAFYTRGGLTLTLFRAHLWQSMWSKTLPAKKTGSVFYVQGVCIVTPGRGLCKWLLWGQFKDCSAIDKEYNHLVYTLSTW